REMSGAGGAVIGEGAQPGVPRQIAGFYSWHGDDGAPGWVADQVVPALDSLANSEKARQDFTRRLAKAIGTRTRRSSSVEGEDGIRHIPPPILVETPTAITTRPVARDGAVEVNLQGAAVKIVDDATTVARRLVVRDRTVGHVQVAGVEATSIPSRRP